MAARKKVSIAAIRTAVADYMSSEGCSCCQNIEAHAEHKAALAYSDGSGYDFWQFITKEAK